MPFFVVSFIAGALTVLAPCILPVLPVVLGGSVSESNSKWRPLIITLSLSFSIVVFTLLLRVSTALISIHPLFWQILSGGIIILFGLASLFPGLWARVSGALGFQGRAEGLLSKASGGNGFWSAALVGFALGPVFASCSPTYFIILGVVLPASFAEGVLYLTIYSLGLAAVLLPIAYLGTALISRLRWAANPSGWFKKILGILFIVVGLMVATGYEKKLEVYLLDLGAYDYLGEIETELVESAGMSVGP